MTATNLKVVHESETQRQHVRVEIPAQGLIGDKYFKVKDISSGGVRLACDAPPSPPEKSVKIRFMFAFKNFFMHVDIPSRLVHFDRAAGVAGYQFVEVGDRQISLINYVIKSYLSGTMVTEGGLIDSAFRHGHTNPRNRKSEPAPQRMKIATIKTIAPFALICLAALAGLALLSANVYERATVLKAHRAMVVADDILLKSQTMGVFHTTLPPDTEQVVKGEVLGSITPAVGGPASPMGASVQIAPQDVLIKSPCNCYLARQFARDGEFRGYGEPLFSLIPVDSQPWVTALVPYEQVHKLHLQDTASIKIVGEGTFTEGHIMNIESVSLDRPVAEVSIKPKTPLPSRMVGLPAYAEFNTGYMP